MTWDVVVVGAGAAGFLAATRAAERNRKTLLLEKNRHPGVKILMSGGTRCNLTQATDRRGIVQAFGRHQGSFLQSALASLGPTDLVDLVEAEGVKTKVEPTGKIFPVSNRAADVVAALMRRLERSGATLSLDEPLLEIEQAENRFLLNTPKRRIETGKLVITTGGRSYPGCGTRGDGYAWAAAFGHTIVEPRPALAPITTHADWIPPLRGVTIEDVSIQIVEARPSTDGEASMIQSTRGGKKRRSGALAERRGSFLFTHFGLSGPVVLDVSRAVSGHPNPAQLDLVCDFLPAIGREQLDVELRDQCAQDGRRQVLVTLARWIPKRLAETFLEQSGVSLDQRGSEFGKRARLEIVERIKATRIPVAGTMGFRKAEVTAGGVALGEVDSSTMQSKLIPGLYFAGEVLDLDGPIGGYNFQAAFSTGWLAGERV